MIPRAAISQAPYLRDLEACQSRALDHMRTARQQGADLIVFPEWSLGLNPVEVLPNRQTEVLAQGARELGLMVVAGSVRSLDPLTGRKNQRAFLVDCDGRLLGTQAKCEFYPPERPWFEPGDGIHAIATRFGRFALLQGPDALSEERWRECREERVDVVVMTVSARTQREHARLVETVVAKSLELEALVILGALSGRFSGTQYLGGALAALKGRLLVDGGEGGERVVLANPAGGALIRLGVTDAAAWAPLAPPPPGLPAPAPDRPDDPEPERRVLVDWGLITDRDPLPGGRQLLARASESPRTVALAPAIPGRAREMAQLLTEGARGAFGWPARSGVALDDDAWLQLADVLSSIGRPLILQMRPGPFSLRLSNPLSADDLLRAFPSLTVLLLGAGSHARWADDALLLAAVRPNVWLDTSGADDDFLRDALEAAGAHRMVFATGLEGPFARAWTALEAWRAEAPTPDDTFSQIAGLNARRLFFGDGPPGRSRPNPETLERVF